MTEVATQAEAKAGTERRATAVRPFDISFPEAELAELRRRLMAARWPERETVADDSQGVQLATIQDLALYWATQYEWRTCEARLNALPNFLTEIDGLDIHFIHVRSRHEDALPMILTHGWPGSILEFLNVIDRLTDPTAHGGTEADAFHVVIPSMPGYGFSGMPEATGWGPQRIAQAWITLMRRLGYDRFVAQGGDWGAVITELIALEGPGELLAIHTNMPGAVPPEVDVAARAGGPAPPGLSEEERRAFDKLVVTYQHAGYAALMGTRPQTLTALADSPVGLAAFMIDHDLWSQQLIARVFAGQCEGFSRDDILDNITLYWLTNTALSSARLYWENKLGYFAPKGVMVPVAVSVFPDEIDPCPRSWAQRAYPNLIYYNQVAKGGHFAAWEQPALFADELRAAFRTLHKH